MKKLLSLASLLSLLAPALAQQTASPTPDLSTLRQNYLNSLDQLLIQDVKASDLTAARAVIDEIEKVSPPQSTPAITQTAPIDETKSPCGNWVWHGGVLIVALNSDGTVSSDGSVTKSVWHWVDQPNRTLRIDWTSGWIDHLTLSADGQSMDCVNNNGDTFTVNRLSKDAQSTTAAGN